MTKRNPDSPTKTCTIPDCDRALRAREMCAKHYNQADPNRHKQGPRACVICGTTVVRRIDTKRQPTCSVRCRTLVQYGVDLAPPPGYDWVSMAVHRAKTYGSDIVDRYDRTDVFNRDGWRCHACGVQCHEPSPYDPLSATIDHVIPLHDGGAHSLANAATACLSCNAAKRGQLAA